MTANPDNIKVIHVRATKSENSSWTKTLSKYFRQRAKQLTFDRRALALSSLEQGDRVETTDEDEDLQKVLKISKENTNIATSYDDQLRERRARMKRRAEEDLRPGSIKRSPSESLASNIRSSSSSPKSLPKPLSSSLSTSAVHQS